MATKPTLLSLRREAKLTTEQLSQEAGVSTTDTYTVEIGGFINHEIACKVLDAFSRLSGTHYTLDDIQLQNIPKLSPISFSQSEAQRS